MGIDKKVPTDSLGRSFLIYILAILLRVPADVNRQIRGDLSKTVEHREGQHAVIFQIADRRVVDGDRRACRRCSAATSYELSSMAKTTFALCVAFVLGLLSPLTTETKVQAKEDENRQAKKAAKIYVIVTAQLYEVDDAFYKKLAKARWRSKEDLDELERIFLNPPEKRQPDAPSEYVPLEKQKLLLTGKKINIAPGQESLVLVVSKTINCLQSPDQLRQGKKGLQTIQEGVSLRVHIQISLDRRFLRVKFMEKSLELEGIEKVKVVLGDKEKEVVGEVAFVKEAELSRVRDIPDGGTFLLPLQYRPRATRDKDRWLVAQLVPRIYIEAEERELRGPVPK